MKYLRKEFQVFLRHWTNINILSRTGFHSFAGNYCVDTYKIFLDFFPMEQIL